MNVIPFQPKAERSVQEAIDAAASKGFKSIVIVGVYEDGTSHLFHYSNNSLVLLGAISAMQMLTYERWKDLEDV